MKLKKIEISQAYFRISQKNIRKSVTQDFENVKMYQLAFIIYCNSILINSFTTHA
jgi:hypothetical protein